MKRYISKCVILSLIFSLIYTSVFAYEEEEEVVNNDILLEVINSQNRRAKN